ncbi:MAG: arsenate reductase ArsC [Syntrophobacteraceae bacterium]|jgi:arsenate reductase
MEKKKVLFICVHNAARSQMAEAFLNDLGADVFEANSAGLEPTSVNPLVIEVMKELGYDLSKSRAKSVFALYKAGMLFYCVITVCKESIENKCPIFPGITKRLHWGFDDPAALQGTDNEKLEETRRIRDEIKSKVESWIVETRIGSGQED